MPVACGARNGYCNMNYQTTRNNLRFGKKINSKNLLFLRRFLTLQISQIKIIAYFHRPLTVICAIFSLMRHSKK